VSILHKYIRPARYETTGPLLQVQFIKSNTNKQVAPKLIWIIQQSKQLTRLFSVFAI